MEQLFVWVKKKQEILRNLSVLSGAEGQIRLYDFTKGKNYRYRGLCPYTRCTGKCTEHHTKTAKERRTHYYGGGLRRRPG